MIKKLRNIFGYDWVQVWSSVGSWTNPDGSLLNRCQFMIDWSESRNSFRLRIDGHMPKTHKLYEEALNKLNKLNLDLINDISYKRDRKLRDLGI